MEQNFFNQWMQCIGSSVFDFCGTPPDGGVGVEAFEVGGDAFGITRLGGVSGGPLAAGLDFNSSIAFKAASSFACSIDSRLWSFIVIHCWLVCWVKPFSTRSKVIAKTSFFTNTTVNLARYWNIKTLILNLLTRTTRWGCWPALCSHRHSARRSTGPGLKTECSKVGANEIANWH